MLSVKYQRYFLWFCAFCILPILFLFVMECYRGFKKEDDRRNYKIYIKVENQSDSDIIAVVFPIPVSKKAMGDIYVEKKTIRKGNHEFISCYAGKDIDLLKDIILGIAVWKTSNEEKEDVLVLQREPYAVKTFYRPEFEVGPEKYGIFTEWVIK